MESPARLVLCCMAVLLAACAAAPRQPAGTQSAAPAAAPRDAVTAAAIERVLAGEHRSEANRAATPGATRSTPAVLPEAPDMTVVEVWHGRVVHGSAGALAATRQTVRSPDPAGGQCVATSMRSVTHQARGAPGSLWQGHGHDIGPGSAEIAPPGSCDLVLTFRNLHK
jgi:predicted methyltransferase